MSAQSQMKSCVVALGEDCAVSTDLAFKNRGFGMRYINPSPLNPTVDTAKMSGVDEKNRKEPLITVDSAPPRGMPSGGHKRHVATPLESSTQ